MEFVSGIISVLDKTPLMCAILDNDKDRQVLISAVLNDIGFFVRPFGCRQDFLLACKSFRFNVILLDWDFDDSNAEVVHSVYGYGEPFPSLIIMCDEGSNASFLLDIKPAGFLFKPFKAAQLMKILYNAIGE